MWKYFSNFIHPFLNFLQRLLLKLRFVPVRRAMRSRWPRNWRRLSKAAQKQMSRQRERRVGPRRRTLRSHTTPTCSGRLIMSHPCTNPSPGREWEGKRGNHAAIETQRATCSVNQTTLLRQTIWVVLTYTTPLTTRIALCQGRKPVCRVLGAPAEKIVEKMVSMNYIWLITYYIQMSPKWPCVSALNMCLNAGKNLKDWITNLDCVFMFYMCLWNIGSVSGICCKAVMCCGDSVCLDTQIWLL